MTVESSSGHRSQRRWVIAVIGAVLVVGGAAIGLTVRENQYGPLTAGSFGGLSSQHSFSGDFPPYRLVADSGQLIESMDNRGSVPIRITSMSSGYSPTEIMWSRYQVAPGGDITGIATPWQNFPATIPAHGTIRLLVTVHRSTHCPAAGDVDGQPETYSPYFTVHWKSMLSSHTSQVGGPDPQDGVILC